MVKVCTYRSNRGKIAVCKDAVMNLNLFLKYVHYSHPPTKYNGWKSFLKKSSYLISIIFKERRVSPTWVNFKVIRKILGYTQSHYTEVVQEAIFLQQNMRSGLNLGQLGILKNKLGRLWATFENVFFMFLGTIFFFSF